MRTLLRRPDHKAGDDDDDDDAAKQRKRDENRESEREPRPGRGGRSCLGSREASVVDRVASTLGYM
eukprot:scaffold1439_cov404-Prasinococcus_capsulatus_cf.AAC.14